MRGVYRRYNKDGTLRSRFWQICYADVRGKIKRESSKSTRKSDAEALLRKRKMEVDDGRNPNKRPVPRITLAEFAPKYLGDKKDDQKSYDRTERIVSQLVDDLGHVMLNDFTFSRLQDWVNMRQELGNSKGTVYRYLAVLKNMLRVAKKRHKLSAETFAEIVEFDNPQPKNERLRYLSPEEYHRLVSEADGHTRQVIIIAVGTGMRKGELLKLRWQNVNYDNGKIQLDAAMTKDGDIRVIPMTPEVKHTLRSIDRSPHIDWVWHDKHGRPYADVRKSFMAAVKRAKITDFTFHDLRHTFASNFVMAGGSLAALKTLLGHESMRMVMRYVTLAQGHIDNEIAEFGKRMQVTHKLTHTKTGDGVNAC
ncbi:tyrosine-type recombinase/integrase [Candidatus Latescibacterota bacterium]